jgi:hypothetical protein
VARAKKAKVVSYSSAGSGRSAGHAQFTLLVVGLPSASDWNQLATGSGALRSGAATAPLGPVAEVGLASQAATLNPISLLADGVRVCERLVVDVPDPVSMALRSRAIAGPDSSTARAVSD